MARLPRAALAGHLHLVAQYAAPGTGVFAQAADRDAFAAALREAAKAHQVAVHAYGLFDDGLRLLVTPGHAAGLSRMLQSTGRRFVSGFNRRHQRTGPLWLGRFSAMLVEPGSGFIDCMRYAEAAPAEARASSAAHHLGTHADPVITDHATYWVLGNTPFEREAAYRQLTEHSLTSEIQASIESCLGAGWAYGTERFVAAAEAKASRRLRPRARGRPPAAGRTEK